MDILTDSELAEIEELGGKIVELIDGHKPYVAMYALESVTGFVVCQTSTYENSMRATVMFTQSLQEQIARHFERNENDARN